ncbi:MAG: class I SAM-dependent methyltransferase [Gaiellales bacterium]
MSFAVAAESYDRFMGRYSTRLAPVFADFAEVQRGQTVLDVGCGPGALTAVLVDRVGAGSVAAADPSEPFVAAARERHQGVQVEQSPAETLPFAADSFDRVVAQLVVHFMADPVAGIREMGRVAKPGGRVAACVWDHATGGGPLAGFWEAALTVRPDVPDESGLAGARRGHLTELFVAAGLDDVVETSIGVEVEHTTFADWWEPFTLGVGPAGAFVAGLEPQERADVEAACRAYYPTVPFVVEARAWACAGNAPSFVASAQHAPRGQ